MISKEDRIVVPGISLDLRAWTITLGLYIVLKDYDGHRLTYGNRIVAHSVGLCARRLKKCREHGTCFI